MQGTLLIEATLANTKVAGTIVKSADSSVIVGDGQSQVPLAAGKAVTGWVQTDADTAECDLPAGHGYASGTFDVFWSGGKRLGVTGTVTVNALALDGGAGDDFPASGTTGVVVSTRQQINFALDGDAAKLVVLLATRRAYVELQDAATAVIDARELLADEPFVWYADGYLANPFAGNPITAAYVSNGEAVAGVVALAALVDATP